MRRIGPGLMPRHLQQYVCVHRSPSQNPFAFYHDLFRPANCSGVGAAYFPQDSSLGTQSNGRGAIWRRVFRFLPQIPLAPATWDARPPDGLLDRAEDAGIPLPTLVLLGCPRGQEVRSTWLPILPIKRT